MKKNNNGHRNDSGGEMKFKNVSPHIGNEMLPVVLFVGMHNKPNMQPLDSNTWSGKIIDKIIAGLKNDCIKTNLCNVDYLPNDKKEIEQHNYKWYFKYHNPQSVIVLLGNWVKQNFYRDDEKVIVLNHPSSFICRKNVNEYVINAIVKIKAAS
ncbi:MAG: hypothetical protein RLY43_1237 [Bacteroidota bacterium]